MADTNAEFYDVNTNTWKRWPSAPYTLKYACTVVWRDSFYMFGNGGLYQKFNLTTQTWSVISYVTPGPRNLDHPGCAVLPNEEILVVGGLNSPSSTYVYNAIANTWRITANTTSPQGPTNLLYIGKHLYVLGGYSKFVEKFNFDTFTWSSFSSVQIWRGNGYAGAIEVPADLFSKQLGNCKGTI
jgi:N-acetylneuraminic acid mutarotase